jgi:DNA-binding transcriptional regulator YdaS (Cro superfamily)
MARKLGIPRPTLCAYEKGDRNPSVKRALHIEAITEGELTRETLRPDIYLRVGISDSKIARREG